MASTYYPADAINLAQKFIHGIPVADIGPQICDIVNSIIWRSFYWRWSVSSITTLNLVNGQQDYASSLPSDFYRFRVLKLLGTQQVPVEYRELDEKTYLAVELSRTGGVNDIKLFSVQPESSGLRLDLPPNIQLQYQGVVNTSGTTVTWVSGTQFGTNTAWAGIPIVINAVSYTVSSVASPTSLTLTTSAGAQSGVAYYQPIMQIQGEYQKQPTKITDGNITTTTFPFPDQYYNVFTEGMWWKFYQFADDPRAGSITVNRTGQLTAGGQLGMFMHALGKMAEDEGFTSAGQESQFPQDPLGWTRQANPGLFGY